MESKNRAECLGLNSECTLATAVGCEVYPQYGFSEVAPTALQVIAVNRDAFDKSITGEEKHGGRGGVT